MTELKFDRSRFDQGDAPTRTRDGRKVLWVADSGLDIDHPMVAILEGDIGVSGYARDGRHRLDGRLSGRDLVHEPKMRTLKIAVYRSRDTVTGMTYVVTSDSRATFDSFVDVLRDDGTLLHLLEVEVPE